MSVKARLELKTIMSQLVPLDPEDVVMQMVWSHLYEFLSYEIDNSFFIKASSSNSYIRDQWDGYSRLFSHTTGKFLTGLLPYVTEALKQFGVEYEVVDHRPVYSRGIELATPDIQLRDYQHAALQSILDEKRGIIFARPRSGKTIVEIMMVAKLGIFPVISVCQSIDIAKQTVEKFKQFLPEVEVGIVGDGLCDIKPVTVITIQSIMAAYNVKEKIPKKQMERFLQDTQKGRVQTLVETAKVVWADECHHCASATWKFVLQNKVYAAEYIIGCSGTPYREDNTNLLLEGLLGPIIYQIDYSTLIEESFLVPPTIHLIKLPVTVECDADESYPAIYKKAIVENQVRNHVIASAAANLCNRGKSVMILVKQITHGNELKKMLPFAEFLHAKSKERASLWQQLKVKQLKCLITTLGDEGIDIPSLDVTIVAAGGESAIKAFQRLRCMTPFEGKKHAIIIDFLDPYKYLKRHSNKRAKIYKSERSFRITYKAVDKTGKQIAVKGRR